jgi:hypothetical protein
MEIPQVVQELLSKSLEQVRSRPQHILSPYQRLEIYDAFGPTYYSEQGQARYSTFDNFKLTHADRLRARLALITAQNVLPLWYERWQESELLDTDLMLTDVIWAISDIVLHHGNPEQQAEFGDLFDEGSLKADDLRQAINKLEKQKFDPQQIAILREYLDFAENYVDKPEEFELRFDLARVRSVHSLPTFLLPQFLLQLSTALLDRTMSAADAAKYEEDLWDIFGNGLGYDEEEFPAQAYDVASACYEAYHQGLGIGPYNRQEVTSKTTDADLQGDGAAAAAAHKAFAGIFDDGISTDAFDPERQKQFWEWWLLEAIPQAWEAETHYVEPKDLRTMPFRDTVEVNVHALGEFYEDDEFDDDE